MARRLSIGERATWVSRWQASGLSCVRFARKYGLSPSSLYRWAQLDADAGKPAPGFAEVRVTGAICGASLELAHPGGCVVRVSGAVDEAQLVSVLRALGSC